MPGTLHTQCRHTYRTPSYIPYTVIPYVHVQRRFDRAMDFRTVVYMYVWNDSILSIVRMVYMLVRTYVSQAKQAGSPQQAEEAGPLCRPLAPHTWVHMSDTFMHMFTTLCADTSSTHWAQHCDPRRHVHMYVPCIHTGTTVPPDTMASAHVHVGQGSGEKSP
jgi:hypothetical protein